MKETNIQKSEFRGSEREGCFGVGLGLTGSTFPDYNKRELPAASTRCA